MLAFVMHFRIYAFFGHCNALPRCMLDGRGQTWRHKGNEGTASVQKAMAETGQREDARRRIYASWSGFLSALRLSGPRTFLSFPWKAAVTLQMAAMTTTLNIVLSRRKREVLDYNTCVRKLLWHLANDSHHSAHSQHACHFLLSSVSRASYSNSTGCWMSLNSARHNILSHHDPNASVLSWNTRGRRPCLRCLCPLY